MFLSFYAPVTLRRTGKKRKFPHAGQTDQIDHDLDHLDPSLPL